MIGVATWAQLVLCVGRRRGGAPGVFCKVVAASHCSDTSAVAFPTIGVAHHSAVVLHLSGSVVILLQVRVSGPLCD